MVRVAEVHLTLHVRPRALLACRSPRSANTQRERRPAAIWDRDGHTVGGWHGGAVVYGLFGAVASMTFVARRTPAIVLWLRRIREP